MSVSEWNVKHIVKKILLKLNVCLGKKKEKQKMNSISLKVQMIFVIKEV